MARTARMTVLVAMALAAKAPPPAEASTETTPSRVEGEPQPVTPEVIEQLAELRTRAETAEARLAAAQEENAAMRRRFDLAWQERETALGGKASPPTDDELPAGRAMGPVRGRVARFTIHCHDSTGKPLTVEHGRPIPEGADLSGVPATSIAGEG